MAMIMHSKNHVIHDDGRECHKDLKGVWRYTTRGGLDQKLYDHRCDRSHEETTVKEQHYIHKDGRRCMKTSQGWKHWDHEQPEPGPRQVVDYSCDRSHIPSMIKDGPLPSDRGEFGMPGLGHDKVFALDCPDSLEVQEPIMLVYRDAIVADRWRQGGHRTDAVTDEARYILDILPDVLGKFLRKNAQYARAQSGHDLGLKGIIPDINRKSAALITSVWDYGTSADMQDTDAARDICEDLIGHLLLMIAKMKDM